MTNPQINERLMFAADEQPLEMTKLNGADLAVLIRLAKYYEDFNWIPQMVKRYINCWSRSLN